MHFLLQREEVSLIEKSAVRTASMLTDAKLSVISMNALLADGRPGDISAKAVPVGTVEFVSAAMNVHDLAQPENISYPECLHSFLGRNVWEGVLGDAAGDVFVKPRHDLKRFTGGMLVDLMADPDFMHLAPDFPVWFSEPVKFVSEWRYYILHNQIVGAGRYDDGEDDAPVPYIKQIEGAVTTMKAHRAPVGYSLDFGVLDDGRTVLVEANDGWALGLYKGSCSYVDYAKLLHERWKQITKSIS